MAGREGAEKSDLCKGEIGECCGVKKIKNMDNIKRTRIEHCRILAISTKINYDAIDVIYCPILKENVVFNARGFHHLCYESDGTPRDANEKIYKMTLFPLAIPVIKNAIGMAEERSVEVRVSRKKNTKLKKGKTYALVALVGRKNPVKIRVILLRIGNGNLMFRSIMKD